MAMTQNKHLTEWKRSDAEWLNEVPNSALQETLRQLDAAYKHFWRRCQQGAEDVGYPTYHGRGNGGSFTVRGTIIVAERSVRLPWAKAGDDLGVVRLKERGYLPCGKFAAPTNSNGEVKIQSATVTERAGRWFVSLQGEAEAPEVTGRAAGTLGIHLGVRVLATASDGRRWANPEHLNAELHRLRVAQRTADRREPKPGQRGSNRYHDAKRRVAVLHYRIACARATALHQVSHEVLASAPERVVLDGWDVAGMLADAPCHQLARRVADASMGELRRQLAYKAEWAGVELVLTPDGYASTRTCSECGWVRPTELRGHEFCCEACGYRAEREDNSARNLVNYAAGKRPEAQNAQGEVAA